MTAREIRERAWALLAAQWQKVLGFSLIGGVLIYLVETALDRLSQDGFIGGLISLAGSIVLLPIYYSVYWVAMRLLRTNELVIQEAFEPYQTIDSFFKFVGTAILTYIFTVLWTLLFIIPGIIKIFSYALVPFILKDKPELSILDTITLSRKMMDGHKGQLFWLSLTFIGWFILCILTFGLLFLWVTPYHMTAYTVFYEERKSEYEGCI